MTRNWSSSSTSRASASFLSKAGQAPNAGFLRGGDGKPRGVPVVVISVLAGSVTPSMAHGSGRSGRQGHRRAYGLADGSKEPNLLAATLHAWLPEVGPPKAS